MSNKYTYIKDSSKRPTRPKGRRIPMGSAAPMPTQAVVQSVINRNTETKYFDTSFSKTVANANDWTGTEVTCSNYIQSDGTTVGAYTDCALIPSAVGAGYGQIQGSKYFLRKIRIRGCLNGGVLSDQADMPNPQSIRIALVMDTQPQGSQAQGESVFSDMGTNFQCNFSYLAMGAGSGGRFKILKEKLIALQPCAAGTDGANTNSVVTSLVHFKMAYYWKDAGYQVQVKANSSTPTVASLANCNIFLLVHSNGAAGITGVARAYYHD